MGAKWEEQLCFRLARVAVTGGVHLGLPKGEVSMGPWQVLTQHLASLLGALWAASGGQGESGLKAGSLGSS